MALTKVTKSGITDNAIDADKIEDGTILDADITPGTITNAKLAGSIANAKLANSTLTINGSSVSLGSSISAGALDWQAVITADGSTGTTGVAGRGYFINTTSAAHTFTLPVSAAIGDTIGIVDYAGTFATNKLTIARNGHNIQGVANNSLLGTNRASVTLVYVDATKGWVYQNESNVADLQAALFITATGGTITTSGNFKIHSFIGDGCFVVSQVGNPSGGGSNVDYLVVAGGGGGGKNHGAGGGAGGFREGRVLPAPESYTASPLVAPAGLPVSATTYPITVGAGGTAPGPAAIPGGPFGTQGSSSIFSTITSAGGGVGATEDQNNPARAGGSGGGGTYSPNPGDNPGAAGNTPPVSPPQGNPGGQGGTYAPGSASVGGGGGATVAGAAGTVPSSGAGGAGATTSISGSSTSYAGGGGGGGTFYGAPSPAPGGTGGGGAGSASPTGTGTAGTDNTGGGGGGGKGGPGNGQGAAGGKGIVVIRYKFQ